MQKQIISQVPGLDFDFKAVSVETLKQYKQDIFKEVEETFNKVATLQGEKTFENIARPLIEIQANIQVRMNSFGFAESFYTSEELRKYASEQSAEISKFLIDQSQRKDVYQVFMEYEKTTFQKEKESLTFEENKYVEKSIRDFRRNGLHLKDQEFIDMKKELADLTVKFNSNINEENTKFEFTRKELDGLPESWFTKTRLLKENENKDEEVYQFTLKYPDYYPGMQYIKSSDLKNKIAFAYNNRCAEQNDPIISRATYLRYQIAKKLGYSNHADFVTEVKIVKNGQNALDFESGLNQKFEPLYQQDMQNLLEFAKNYKENPLQKNKLDPWDITYYMRAYKEVTCDINMEDIKKYFPITKVTEGLFAIYQKLLGLVFEEVHTDNKWHESVQLYSVKDAQSNQLMGYFYFDLYPRDGKYSHAACFEFQDGCDATKFQNEKMRQQGRTLNVCCIACNFEPSGCISFSDVETFFHEFGHVMHYICSKTQLQEFQGFKVETDFIEAPSQMLEYWCYEKESVQMMSAHEKTGEPIPDDIVQKLKKMENTLQGYFNKRQIMFGMYDLKVHTMTLEDEKQKLDSVKLWYDNEYEVMHFENSNKAHPAAGFAHLYGGYDAGYYGYLRAESFAANMFYKMFKNGKVLCPESGMRYRQKILEPGSTKDGIQLVRDFLGEEPDDKYFLIAKGLSSQ